MKIITIDAETSLHNDEVGSFKASPFSEKNWIVYFGRHAFDVEEEAWHSLVNTGLSALKPSDMRIAVTPDTPGSYILVGHNIKFDLLHLCNPNNDYSAEWRRLVNDPRLVIWDTMVAEFRLNGQMEPNPSLDSCCEKRGWELKDSRIKEYWNNGVSTEDIPEEEILPYLAHDVQSTSRLFLDQVKQATEKRMMPLLRVEMDAVLATTIMELNGVHFDKRGAEIALNDRMLPALEATRSKLVVDIMRMEGLREEAVNPDSNVFLKAWLYGGTYKYKYRTVMKDDDGEVVVFKSGKRKGEPRPKVIEDVLALEGVAPAKLKDVSEDSLRKLLANRALHPQLKPVLEDLLGYRDLGKQAKTYYKGYAELTWPDGYIHPNLNHAVTNTARLSCSAPNLQNAGHSSIRDHFVSRYEDGKLMEADLSQIEVVVQAFLAQDEAMIEDIMDQVDFHSKRAAFAFQENYEDVLRWVQEENEEWVKKRKHSKVVSFQKAYGAGIKKIVESTGLAEATVKAFMEAEDRAYPRVPGMQQEWINAVARSAYRMPDGEVVGEISSPTGAFYRFRRYEDFKGNLTFKPTMIKNYPIQGMAADIIKIIIGELREMLQTWNAQRSTPALMINTVHDSVLFDLPRMMSGDYKIFAKDVEIVMTEVTLQVLRDRFGINFNVPIRADFEIGDTWNDMKPLHT